MKISVSSYSFDKYIRETNCDYIAVCDKAKELGFEGIEFIQLDYYDKRDNLIDLAFEIRAHCERIGLEIVAYTVSANLAERKGWEEVKKLKESVDICEALGAPLFRHDVCQKLPEGVTVERAIKRMTPRIRRVTEYAKKRGIKTCTENHGFVFQSPEVMEKLIKAVDRANYGWLVDIGNFLCSDSEPLSSVKIASPYAVHLHAKDFLMLDENDTSSDGVLTTNAGKKIVGTVLGKGVVPVADCIKVMKESGYDDFVTVEFEGREDNLTALAESLEVLKKI